MLTWKAICSTDIIQTNLNSWILTFVALDLMNIHHIAGLPWWLSGKENTCQRRKRGRHGFDPWVRKISWRGMVTHPGILAWIIPWTEGPGRLQSMGGRVGHSWTTEHTHTHTHTHHHTAALWCERHNQAKQAIKGVHTLKLVIHNMEGM